MILQFSKAQVVAFAQSGMMNIKSGFHWDICNAIASGKTMETVADDFKIHYNTVKQIKRCKCPEL